MRKHCRLERLVRLIFLSTKLIYLIYCCSIIFLIFKFIKKNNIQKGDVVYIIKNKLYYYFIYDGLFSCIDGKSLVKIYHYNFEFSPLYWNNCISILDDFTYHNLLITTEESHLDIYKPEYGCHFIYTINRSYDSDIYYHKKEKYFILEDVINEHSYLLEN